MKFLIVTCLAVAMFGVVSTTAAISKVIDLGCFPHSPREDVFTLPKIPETNSGFMFLEPNSPFICGASCRQANPLYVFAGVTQGRECWCGDASAAGNLHLGETVSDGVSCEKWISGYAKGSLIPCHDPNGSPAFTSWPANPAPQANYGYCGGNGVMRAYKIISD